jgi:hypothetical protein
MAVAELGNDGRDVQRRPIGEYGGDSYKCPSRLAIEIFAWISAEAGMYDGSRQIHQRAVTVAVAGILFGTLSQASLIDASIWTQSGTRPILGLSVARAIQSYNASGLGKPAQPHEVARVTPPPALPTPRVRPPFRSKSRIASSNISN